jgi:hypothetical protein
MRYQEECYRAQRLWQQPMLAEELLRGVYISGKWGIRLKARLSPDQFRHNLRASRVTVRTMRFGGQGRSGWIGCASLYLDILVVVVVVFVD